MNRNAGPPPALIETTDALAALCERLRAEPFVTVDTEFMRERTYWPELCVVQLGGAAEVAVIDALAPGIDLAPLGALLADAAVTKVFHAARQDIEIFVLRFGDVPRPLFDTQVAAMVAGFGDQVGYEALVSALAGGAVDKGHRFSDWAARPLSPGQVAYAAGDVTHLRRVYEALRRRLEREGRVEWVAAELAELADPATYRTDPETAWERLRVRSGNRRYMAQVRALAAWREREAQRVNIPRQRVVRDETLLEIAAVAPENAEALARARGISRGFAEGKMGASLLTVVEMTRRLPEDELPGTAHRPDGKRPSPGLVALLKVLLASASDAHGVAARLIASGEDIDRLAAEEAPDVPALHGWRRDVFGADALALIGGRVGLAVTGRKVRLVPVSETVLGA